MKHISLNSQDDSISRFLLRLAVDTEGSVFEWDGKAIGRFMPVRRSESLASKSDEWNNELNNRRCLLIDRKYGGSLTEEESIELEELQERMERFREKVAPLPIEEARQLYQHLLMQAAAARAKAP